MAGEDSEVVESYRNSLDDLIINSKPLISMLTMLAEDSIHVADQIVKVIEEQIKKVPVSRKLPILYLIDSVMKNLSETKYPQLFEQYIVQIFSGTFEEVDEKTRQSMYKLRQTWVDILSNKRLYALDMRVNRIDKAWPITAKPPEQGVIHVNPKFLKTQAVPEVDEELSAKEKEKIRLDKELAATKAKLEQANKELERQAMQAKVSKKMIDREPPSLLALPPANNPVTQTPPVRPDPRLNRDPRMVNRDPRLKADSTPEKESQGQPTTSPKRLDLATLLNSFKDVATKVAEVQAKKKSPVSSPNINSDLNNSSIAPVSTKGREPSTSKPKDHERGSSRDRRDISPHKSSKHASDKSNHRSSSKERVDNRMDIKNNLTTSRVSKEVKKPSLSKESTKVKEDKPLKSALKQRKDKPIDELSKTFIKQTKEEPVKPILKEEKGEVIEKPLKSALKSKGKVQGDVKPALKQDKTKIIEKKSPKPSLKSEGKEASLQKSVKQNKGKVSAKEMSTLALKRSKENEKEAPQFKPSKEKSIEKGVQKKVRIGRKDIERKSVLDTGRISPRASFHRSPLDRRRGFALRGARTTGRLLERRRSKLAEEAGLRGSIFDSNARGVEGGNAVGDDMDIDDEGSKLEPSPMEQAVDVDMRVGMREPLGVVSMDQSRKRNISDSSEPMPSDEPVNKRLKTPAPNQDISQLFGEEDVDYRSLNQGQSSMAPPPMPSPVLLSPPVKSNTQRGWSQFKEQHPDDFAQETERKRIRDAQMQDVHDVDLRQQSTKAMRMQPIHMPKDLNMGLEKDRILKQAEMEVQEGRMSKEDHEQLLRQIGQVYSRSVHDPRIRGSRDSDRMPQPYSRRAERLHGPSSERSPVYQDRDASGAKGYTNVEEELRQHSRGFERRGSYDKGLNYDDPHLRNKIKNEDFETMRAYRHPEGPRGYDDVSQRRSHSPVDGYSPRELDSSQSSFNRFPHSRSQQLIKEGSQEHEMHSGSPRMHEEADTDFRTNVPIQGDSFAQPQDIRQQHRSLYDNGDTVSGQSRQAPRPVPPELIQGSQPRPRLLPHLLRPEIHGLRPGISVGPQPAPGIVGGVLPKPEVIGGDQPRSAAPTAIKPLMGDPMDDPRWSAMKGLLEQGESEEVVLDDKPFELRMGTCRKLRLYNHEFEIGVNLEERGIVIDGQLVYKLGEPIKEVNINGRPVRLYYHGLPKPIWLDGQYHEMRIDAPPRNVMIDGFQRGFQIDGRDMMMLIDRMEKGAYGGPPRKIHIAGVEHNVMFQFPPRTILIDGKPCELKLDSKIPFVVMEGKPHGIRFDGEPKTVFINDQPFVVPLDRAEKIRIGTRPTYIAFGGPAHEIIIDGKWFEVKFDNTPKDIQLGNRHFKIRIPGPLPKVKILDELRVNFDVSRLFMKNTVEAKKGVQASLSDTSVQPCVLTNKNPQNAGIPTNQVLQAPLVNPGIRPDHPMLRPLIAAGMSHNLIQQGVRILLQGMAQQPPRIAQPKINLQNIINQINSRGPIRGPVPVQPNVVPPPVANPISGSFVSNPVPQTQADPVVTPALLAQVGAAVNTTLPAQVSAAVNPTLPAQVSAAANPTLPAQVSAAPLPHLAAPAPTVPAATVTNTSSALNPSVDINSLLNNLLKVGLIKKDSAQEESNPAKEASSSMEAESTSSPKVEKKEKKRDIIPDLSDFDGDLLKIPYKSVIEELHEGIQCHTCSARFTSEDHEKYRAHLDWHFRQNKQEQETVKVAKNRKWFYTIADWIQYEELEDLEEKSRSEIFEQMRSGVQQDGGSVTLDTLKLAALDGMEVINNPVASGVEGEDICATCGDPFDQLWNEDTEEWILKNAIKLKGKTYHPICFEDLQETPTPAVGVVSNPLLAEIVTEDKHSAMKQEVDPSLKQELEPSVKQEVNPIVKQELDLGLVAVKQEVSHDHCGSSVNVSSGVDSIKMEQEFDDGSSAIFKPLSSTSVARDSAGIPGLADDLPEVKGEYSEPAPTFVSALTNPVNTGKVISVCQEDPNSPWEMDSNPTPELSRTPSPVLEATLTSESPVPVEMTTGPEESYST